ncbi:hypothetical protein ACP70R_044168 [Stipagrostis hirtigluma subsp. patula]
MAAIVGSAVVGELVNKIFSFLMGHHGEKSSRRDKMERLEMAHIKMEAALEMSSQWQLASTPLLQWRRKLKRAAEECEDTRREWKRRAQEDEEAELGVRSSSVPRRVAYQAATSLIHRFTARGNRDESDSLAVQRFERFADAACDFERCTMFRATLGRRSASVIDPIIGNLLAGKALLHQVSRGSRYHVFGARPMNFAEHGPEALVGYGCGDRQAPARSFGLRLLLRISGDTDVVGIMVRCVQLLRPHFRALGNSEDEDHSSQLMKMAQNISAEPFAPPLDDLRPCNCCTSSLQRWLQDPLCCKRRDQRVAALNRGTALNASSLADTFPEQVLIAIGDGYADVGSNLGNGMPAARVGVSFQPYASHGGGCSAVETLDGEEAQGCRFTGGGLQQFDDVVLPNAMERLYRKVEAKKYEAFWNSVHGAAYLRVEKTSAKIPHARGPKSRLRARKSKTVAHGRYAI